MDRSLSNTRCGALLARRGDCRVADGAGRETVTVGMVGAVSSTHWPIYIGLNKGYYAAEDLKPDLVFIQSSAALSQQLTAGSLDIALSTGLADPIRAIDKGGADRDRAHRNAGAALCGARQARHQALGRPQGQDHLDRRPEGYHAHLSRAHGGAERRSSPAITTPCLPARPRLASRRCRAAPSMPRSCCRRSISMRSRRASPISASPSTTPGNCRSPARWSSRAWATSPTRARLQGALGPQQEHGLVLRPAEPRRGDQDHGGGEQAQGGGRREAPTTSSTRTSSSRTRAGSRGPRWARCSRRSKISVTSKARPTSNASCCRA